MQKKINFKTLAFITILQLLIISLIGILSSNNVFIQIFAQNLHNRTLEEIAIQTSGFDKTASIDIGKNPSAIGIHRISNTVYVANSGSNTVSVISTENNTKIGDIPVGKNPRAIAILYDRYIDSSIHTVYTANEDSNSISVINGSTYAFIKDIPVGKNPRAITINEFTNTLYVANYGSNSISVISTENNTKIGDIEVGLGPMAIDVDTFTDKIYVVNSGSNSISVINGSTNKFIKDIPVGKTPDAIAISHDLSLHHSTITVYVANMYSNSISVINGSTNKFIKDIPVGEFPVSMSINEDDIGIKEDINFLYVANLGSNSISVISTENNTKIGDIAVRGIAIAVNPLSDTVYVADADNSISVINGSTNKFIKDIPVGELPTDIGIDTFSNTVYITNYVSNTVSVIDGIANKVVAGVTFEAYPFNTGYIQCGGLKPPLSQYFYIFSGSECIAKPNKGFEFLSWGENLKNNSTQIIKVSQPASIVESIKDFFYIKSEEPEAKLNITKFGSFTANFKELPPPLPPEYWATLFGVVVTAFISSWLTPTIIGWRKAKKHQEKLNDYQKELKDLYKDGKLDKNDILNLDTLRENIISGYGRGDLTKDQYDVLLNNVSIRYNEIFQNRIKVSKTTYNKDKKAKLLDEIYSDLNNAYLTKKIDKEHYDRLKNEISILYQEIFAKRIAEITTMSINEDKTKALNQIKNDIDDTYSQEKINEKHYNLLKEKI